MIATRRAFIATSAATSLLSGGARAAEPSVEIVDYVEDAGPDFAPDPETTRQVVTTPEGRVIVLHARFGKSSNDQWPIVSFTNDSDEYLAASGDGVGFLNDPAIDNLVEKRKLMFSRLRFVVDSGNFEPTRYQAGVDADIKGYNVSDPDDLKPNALFYDQTYGDLHCFVACGTGATSALVNRRRAWLITSFDQGQNWNIGDLPALGVDPDFDATSPVNELVPIGVCNRLGGSVINGYIYFYFNRQGNVKSDEL